MESDDIAKPQPSHSISPITMIKKELWDVLKLNENGSIVEMLTCIAETLHEYAGLIVNISAAEKLADGSFNYIT